MEFAARTFKENDNERTLYKREMLNDFLGGNKQFLKDRLARFLIEIPGLLHEMRIALELKQWSNLHLLASELCLTTLVIGASPSYQAAVRLRDASEVNREGGVLKQMLKTCIAECLILTEKIRKDYPEADHTGRSLMHAY